MYRRQSNYQIQIQRAQMEFVKLDHEFMANKFNLIYDTQYLYLFFVGQMYRIDRKTGVVKKTVDCLELETDFNEVMSIFDLLSYSKSKSVLSGEWTEIQSLIKLAPTGAVSGDNLFSSFAIYFNERKEEFSQACAYLKGEAVKYADVSYIIKVFDVIPVMIQFWASDEEFPAQIRFKWDKNILDIVHFETTYYISFHLLNRIREIMEYHSGLPSC